MIKLFEKGLNPVDVAIIAGRKDADALYAFKNREFGEETRLGKFYFSVTFN